MDECLLVVSLALFVAFVSGYGGTSSLHSVGRSKTSLKAGGTPGPVEVRSVAGLDEGLKMRHLPGTDILVSEVCLGTMMFGDQVDR